MCNSIPVAFLKSQKYGDSKKIGDCQGLGLKGVSKQSVEDSRAATHQMPQWHIWLTSLEGTPPKLNLEQASTLGGDDGCV